MKPPKNSREVFKFLGMTQWYGKFIKNYADVCEPLYELKQKSRKHGVTYRGPLPVKGIADYAALTRLTHGKNLPSRMIRWVLKLAEFNVEWEHRPMKSKCGGRCFV
ncbi:hypothetical protein TNCV_1719121 [Trichonephila clavipes]|nr:hypothetical protein TNCV_1719121 [Trichonephila clavipes]